MSYLLVGDMHLTAQPRDAYRWQVFDVLKKYAKGTTGIVLMGDLSDQKDNHGAQLVNNVCTKLCELARVTEVHVLRGNHDGIDPQWPYFRFLGRFPRIHFYAEPQSLVCDGKPSRILMLPHSRNPLPEWSKIEWSAYDVVLAHVTVKGAVSETGSVLDSVVGADYFKKRNVAVFAGDVHVPQRIGPVTYVGAPYPIRFGDSFTPRLLKLEGRRAKSIELTPVLQRRMMDVTDAADLAKHPWNVGDQVKVRLHLTEENLHTWTKQRAAIVSFCRKRNLDLVDVRVVKEAGSDAKPVPERLQIKRPADTLREYIADRKVDKALAVVGQSLIGSCK